uniref:Uncharacterized protein n=1 Tax=Parascaris univalens TaxID=6257 RepID=A0A915CIJ9_PARUN
MRESARDFKSARGDKRFDVVLKKARPSRTDARETRSGAAKIAQEYPINTTRMEPSYICDEDNAGAFIVKNLWGPSDDNDRSRELKSVCKKNQSWYPEGRWRADGDELNTGQKRAVRVNRGYWKERGESTVGVPGSSITAQRAHSGRIDAELPNIRGTG